MLPHRYFIQEPEPVVAVVVPQQQQQPRATTPDQHYQFVGAASVRKAVRHYPEPPELTLEGASSHQTNFVSPIPTRYQVVSPSYDEKFRQQPTNSFLSPQPLRVPFTSPDETQAANSQQQQQQQVVSERRFVRTGDELFVDLEQETEPVQQEQQQQNETSAERRKRLQLVLTPAIQNNSSNSFQQQQAPEWIAHAGAQRSTLNAILRERAQRQQQGLVAGGFPLPPPPPSSSSVTFSNATTFPSSAVRPAVSPTFSTFSAGAGSNSTQPPNSERAQQESLSQSPTQHNVNTNFPVVVPHSTSNNDPSSFSAGTTSMTQSPVSPLATSSQQQQQNHHHRSNSNVSSKLAYAHHPPYVSAFRRELDELRADVSSIQTVVHGLDSKIERVTNDMFTRLETQLLQIKHALVFDKTPTELLPSTQVLAKAASSPQTQAREGRPVVSNSGEKILPHESTGFSPARPLALLHSPVPKKIRAEDQQQQHVPLSQPLAEATTAVVASNSSGMFLANNNNTSNDNSNNINQVVSAEHFEQLLQAVSKLSERVDVIAASTSSAISSLASAVSGISASQSKIAAVEAEKIATTPSIHNNNNNVRNVVTNLTPSFGLL